MSEKCDNKLEALADKAIREFNQAQNNEQRERIQQAFWRDIYILLKPYIARLTRSNLMQRLRDREYEREECAQEVAVKLSSALPKFIEHRARHSERKVSFAKWVKITVRHAVIDYRRNHKEYRRNRDKPLVLVVDSEPGQRDRIQDALGQRFDVTLSTSTTSCLERLSHHKKSERPDLVFLSLDASNIAVFEALRLAQKNGVPAVVLSSNHVSDVYRAQQEGAFSALSADPEPQELVATVESAIDRHAWVELVQMLDAHEPTKDLRSRLQTIARVRQILDSIAQLPEDERDALMVWMFGTRRQCDATRRALAKLRTRYRPAPNRDVEEN